MKLLYYGFQISQVLHYIRCHDEIEGAVIEGQTGRAGFEKIHIPEPVMCREFTGGRHVQVDGKDRSEAAAQSRQEGAFSTAEIQRSVVVDLVRESKQRRQTPPEDPTNERIRIRINPLLDEVLELKKCPTRYDDELGH